MNVEITVRRISPGVEGAWPVDTNSYGPYLTYLHAGVSGLYEEIDVPPTSGRVWDGMRVGFRDFAPVSDDGWFGGRLGLFRIDGTPITPGPRPCMFFAGPWDTPTFTLFVSPYHGVWQVGLRPT